MNFLEYVKDNKDGLTFIDKMRSVIKNICHDGIKEEFGNIKQKDIDKLSLMLEFNFFDGITSNDSEWDLKTINVDDVKFLIGSSIGFYNLCNGIEKNKRESYSEILYDVIYHLFEIIEFDDELFKSSELVKKVYEIVNMIECGEDGYNLDMLSNEELEQCISILYRYMIKNIITI